MTPSITVRTACAVFFAVAVTAAWCEDPPAAAPAATALVPAPPDDAQRTESGLAFKVLRAGRGEARPKPDDLVTVHYSGWNADGTPLDSTADRGTPLTVQMKRLIPGWIEALQSMTVGEVRRLWIPETLAFQGNPSAPRGTVVYEVELVAFEAGPETPPPDVAGPPSDATVTASGLATRVLVAGRGARHPRGASQVTVQYTGWTTDGKMFDSSVSRGRPATFRLDQVIAGWSEALQLMVEGEKRRLWIPEKLAYRGQKGRPQGMLVFDVELLAIQN